MIIKSILSRLIGSDEQKKSKDPKKKASKKSVKKKEVPKKKSPKKPLQKSIKSKKKSAPKEPTPKIQKPAPKKPKKAATKSKPRPAIKKIVQEPAKKSPLKAAPITKVAAPAKQPLKTRAPQPVTPAPKQPEKKTQQPAPTKNAKKKKSAALTSEINEPKIGSKKEIDIRKELQDQLLEKGKEQGVLTYEEIITFNEKAHLSEKEANDFLKVLEKEHIELVMEEELADDPEFAGLDKDDYDTDTKTKIKAKLSASEDPDEVHDDDDEEKEEHDVSEATHITDGVKCYLRDIGKIPLLNKTTEKVIADQIANSKRLCIDAISHFPFVHKEFISMIDRLNKNTLPLKDIIQFAEYDEENIPKIDEEQTAFLKSLTTLAALIKNEETIYHSYRKDLAIPGKKKEMLDKVQENKLAISEAIKSIKLANKFIRKIGKRIEKLLSPNPARTPTNNAKHLNTPILSLSISTANNTLPIKS